MRCAQLSHHSLIQYRLPATRELIPLLQITALLRLGSAGNIRSKTLRAFDSDEMAGIIGRTG